MSLSLIRRLARRTGTARLSATVGPHNVSLPVLQLNAVRRLPVSRTYASKAKAKSTASFVPGSKQLFESEDARAEYAKAESKMASVVDWFRKEVAAFETRASGRVTPALLSPVRVEKGRGQTVTLEEVATVGIKDGSVLIVTVFDEHVRGAFFLSLSHFFFFFLVVGLLADELEYSAEYEGGRAGDICCETTTHCSSTVGFADAEDTNTQVSSFSNMFYAPADVCCFIGQQSKAEIRLLIPPAEWQKTCVFKSASTNKPALRRASTRNTRWNSRR
jgi:hypothetical protein